MDKDYMLQEDGSFIIKNYNSKHPFSNFLPGVSGAWGVPMWVFYVNRAQGIISFGSKDKDHSIAEFFPANKAYSLAPLLGFRTFLKINHETTYEPFRVISDYEREEEMVIRSHSFEIRKTNYKLGLSFRVRYFTLPTTPVGSLVRILSIKNISDKDIDLEVLDGIPRIVPFGLSHVLLKDLARTLEAWMHSKAEGKLATFRLIVDPKDSSQTRYVDGANFNYAFYPEAGKTVAPYLIVDPSALFGQDTSFSFPVRFYEEGFKVPLSQIDCGKTPCAFSHFSWKLSAGETRDFYSIFGSSFKSQLIKDFVAGIDAQFIQDKEKENERLITKLKNHALVVSGYKEFDEYVQNSYMDNVLRGGYPYTFDDKHIYYIFSRKHGDLERDYNKFKLSPSYFSEGEANYRDINQNRRIDLFFNPRIGKTNIVYFLNLIKIDGYNPLVVKGERLFLKSKTAGKILKEFRINNKKLLHLLTSGFHLGECFKVLKEEGLEVKDKEVFVKRLVEEASRQPFASHGEGYWIDHWRYNLDLIENYLYFYPDKLRELYQSREYYFWDDEYRVKERRRRYHLKDDTVYQWHSVEEVAEKKEIVEKRLSNGNFLRDKKGRIYKTTLLEKIFSLILNKLATLDPEGIGIEMEADKPGWCDSLNGLPALFGSSLCETLELKRACIMLQEAITHLKAEGVKKMTCAQENALFFKRLRILLKNYLISEKNSRDIIWWDKANTVKEQFRRSTFFTISGVTTELKLAELESFLADVLAKLTIGIEKAKDSSDGLCHAYFTYKVKKYHLTKKELMPLEFTKSPLPYFLEGPVHCLRVEKKRSTYHAVRTSELFDEQLKMYRLNASLASQPLEIGRSRIFMPGWLENESIWLHMEYKYLLEMLKTGLHEEFFKDFHNCCVCFFDPETYGRNTLESSSFIVSSAYLDKSLWGKGFVARLSGATVEILNIWMLLCLGKEPFFIAKDNSLNIKFSPTLKADFFTTQDRTITFKEKVVTLDKNCFAFNLFSSTLVVYHNPKRKDTFKDGCKVSRVVLVQDGKNHIVEGDTVSSSLAIAVRNRQIERIDVYLI
ncbi:MAG: hypothetical protein WCI77_08335 [Candidatus Omnitrophota bacterium]